MFSSEAIESCSERIGQGVTTRDPLRLSCARSDGTLNLTSGYQTVEKEVVQGPVHGVLADTTLNHPTVRGLGPAMDSLFTAMKTWQPALRRPYSDAS